LHNGAACDDGCTRGDKNDKTPLFLRARSSFTFIIHVALDRTEECVIRVHSAVQIRDVYCLKRYRLSSNNIFRAASSTAGSAIRACLRANNPAFGSVSFAKCARSWLYFIFLCSSLFFIRPTFFQRPRSLLPGNAKFRCNSVRRIPSQQWWFYLFRARDIRITTSRSSVTFRGTNPLCERWIIYFSYIIDGLTSRGLQGN